MRYRSGLVWIAVVAAGTYAAVAEVSVGDSPGPGVGLILMGRGGEGPGDAWPWLIYRLHIDPSRALDPGGDAEGDVGPEFAIDPVSVAPHVVWADGDGAGGDREIAVSFWDGTGWSAPERLTDDDGEDLDPSIAFAPDGTCRIAWWRPGAASGGEVVYAERSPQESWTSPQPVHGAEEAASRPSVADLGGAAWVAYQSEGAGVRRVAVSRRIGASWVEQVVAQTPYAGALGDGDIDVEIHSRGRVLWVDWVDGPGVLAYAVWDAASQSWSSPETVSYQPRPGEAEFHARTRARTSVRLAATRGR